jgi:hypothetical protein
MDDPTFTATARLAAAALISETGGAPGVLDLDGLTGLVALAWLQGYGVGAAAVMEQAEEAFTRLSETLAAAVTS